MLLRSTHCTRYRYRTPSTASHNEVRLQPLTDVNQVCRSFQIVTRPETAIHKYEDLGGVVHHFCIAGAHQDLEILAVAEVETFLADPFIGLDLASDDWSFYRENGPAASQYAEFLTATPYVARNIEAARLAREVREASAGGVARYLLDLAGYIYRNFAYDPDVTHVHSTMEEVLALRAGVCQDFAHLMIGCCRSQGIPARYVSGYLLSEEGYEMRGDQAMHAWLECPLPDGRWLAVDPTNKLLANDRYVRVHIGRDYGEAAPIRGIYMGVPAESLEVTLKVEKAVATPPAR